MIQAYLDESGIQTGAKVCLIAGYFGGIGQWKRLGDKWSGILRKFSVPEFHARQFWAFDNRAERVGPYTGWTDSKAEAFLGELIKIITSHRIHPIAVTVDSEAFDRLSYNQRRFLTGSVVRNGRFIGSGAPSKAYFLPFQICVVRIALHAPRGGRAHYAFDLNNNFRGYALDLFRIVKSQNNLSAWDRIGEVSFPTGLQAVQLQVADLFCYLSYQDSQKRIYDGTLPIPPLLGRLLKNALTQEDFPLLNDEGLRYLLSDTRLPPEPSGR